MFLSGLQTRVLLSSTELMAIFISIPFYNRRTFKSSIEKTNLEKTNWLGHKKLNTNSASEICTNFINHVRNPNTARFELGRIPINYLISEFGSENFNPRKTIACCEKCTIEQRIEVRFQNNLTTEHIHDLRQRPPNSCGAYNRGRSFFSTVVTYMFLCWVLLAGSNGVLV